MNRAVALTVTVVVVGGLVGTTALEANDLVMKVELVDSVSSALEVVGAGFDKTFGTSDVGEGGEEAPSVSVAPPIVEVTSDAGPRAGGADVGCSEVEVSVTVTVKVMSEPSRVTVVVLL